MKSLKLPTCLVGPLEQFYIKDYVSDFTLGSKT